MGPKESRLDHGVPESLVRDVRQHRQNIDSLLDELSSLAHPKTMLRQAVDWVRSGENRQSVKDKAAGAGVSIKESGREVGKKISGKIMDLTHDAKEASRELFERKRAQTQEGLHQARTTARREISQVREKTVSTTHDNPLGLALGCLGAGLMLGMMFPSTRTEKKAVRQAQDAVSREPLRSADDTATSQRPGIASAS